MPIQSLPYWVDQLKTDGKLAGTIDAYERNPVVYRAVNLRCDAISSVPFKVERNGEESDWHFTTPLPSLIRDTERSLLLTGAAFWLRLKRGKILLGFRVLNPLTMRVHYNQQDYDPMNPLASFRFEQVVGANKWTFTSEDIVYFREPSFTDEVKSGLAPAEVAQQSAQLNYYLERFNSAFFEHGAQPITIMSMPSDVTQAEAQRFENDWRSKVTGLINSFRTVFIRGGDIKTTVITPPLKDLMLPELYDNTVKSISMALGVPRTMLEASAANYATAESDRKSFWRETVIPRIPLYEYNINDQLLSELGYRLTFQPEALDVMQEDENQRASSLKLLTDAGVPLKDAMIILGFDYEITPQTVLPPSVSEDVYVEEPPREVEVASVTEEVVESEVDKPLPRSYKLWRKKAERQINAGKSMDFVFVSEEIDAEDHAWISYNLQLCKDSHDVKHLFDSLKASISESERPLYNAVVATLKSIGDDFIANVIPMISSGSVQEDDALFDELEVVMRPLLYQRAFNRLSELQDRYTIDIDDALEATLINEQIDAYMPKMIKGMTDTTYALVKQIIDKARLSGGYTNEQLVALLSPAFGKRRAEMIAVTEYTRSASMATTVYSNYLADFGVKTVRVWNTENDEIVKRCPICYPLNGKTDDVWSEKYPDGAPAHPRCRCDVSIRIVR